MDKIYHIEDIEMQSIELYNWTIDYIHINDQFIIKKDWFNIKQIKMKHIWKEWHIINKQDLPQK